VKWHSPEIIKNKEYSFKSDVWSFGVCMWEIFEKGATPFGSISNEEAMQVILQGDKLPKPSKCPQNIYLLMLQCWDELEERIEFNSIHKSLIKILREYP